MVIFRLWSGHCHRVGDDFCSWRLAKGARIRQADSLRAAFLRSATCRLRYRTFDPDGGHRVACTEVDSMAPVLGVLRRRLLYRRGAELGDKDSGASRGEF